MIIQGGTGNGFAAQVDDDHRLATYATVETEMSHTSEDHGDAYAWTASVNVAGDKNVIWLRSDHTTKNLVIECIHVGVSATTLIELWVGSGTTASGTAVTGVNLNRQSGNVALATCKHTETNVDAGSGLTLLSSFSVLTGQTHTFEMHGGLLLGYLDEIAINVITDIDLTSVTIFGYYHEA